MDSDVIYLYLIGFQMWYQHIYILSHADESAFYKNWAAYKKVLFESDLALLYINISKQ